MDDPCGEIFEAIGDVLGESVGESGPGPFPWLALALLLFCLGVVAYYHETEHVRPKAAATAAAAPRP